MFFWWFKKIVSGFIYPIPFCGLLLAVGCYILWRTKYQKTGKGLVTAGTFLLLLFSWPLLPKATIPPLECRFAPLKEEQLNEKQAELQAEVATPWVVVLGKGYHADEERPFNMWASPGLWVRIIEGVRIHKEIPDSRLLIGFPEGTEEGFIDYFVAKMSQMFDIDAGDVTVIADALSTRDEARRAGKIVGDGPCFLVSEGHHLPRAASLFRQYGTEVIPSPARYLHGPEALRKWSALDVFPSSHNTEDMRKAIHEYAGLLVATISASRSDKDAGSGEKETAGGE